MSGVWTRNYSNMLVRCLGSAGSNPSSSASSYQNDNLSVKSFTGSTAIAYDTSNQLINLPTITNILYGHFGSSAGISMEFGSGTTPPTFDDYRVETPIGNFTVSQANIAVNRYVWNSTDKNYSSTNRFVLQYTGSTPVELKEFGMYLRSDYDWAANLIYREVFDTPITVNQYESVVIELSQAFPIINYEPYPT